MSATISAPSTAPTGPARGSTLILRTEQVEALRTARTSDFTLRMRAHLRRCFRATANVMADDELDAVVAHGRERALTHGIESERGICKFINLMFVFGRDFDRDPRLPWAKEILDGTRVHRGRSTIDLLYHEATLHDVPVLGLEGTRA